MNEVNARLLIEALGSEGEPRTEEWFVAHCPLAFARHKGGKDQSPSFGIFLNPTGKSGFNCYSCHIKGKTLDGLLTEVHYYMTRGEAPKHINLAAAYQILEEENTAGYFGAEWTGIVAAQNKFEAWPQWWFDSFPPVTKFEQAMAYLHARGVPEALWSIFKLRYDPKRKMIGFPFFNRAGKLAGMRGRDIRPHSNFPHYDYRWDSRVNNTALVLMGEHEVDFMKPVVVVEGEYDRAAVYQVYPNVLANLSASLSLQKVRKLEAAVELVGFFDDDEAGVIASKILMDRFKGRGSYREVDYGPAAAWRTKDDDLRDPGDFCNQLQNLRVLLEPYVPLDAAKSEA